MYLFLYIFYNCVTFFLTKCHSFKNAKGNSEFYILFSQVEINDIKRAIFLVASNYWVMEAWSLIYFTFYFVYWSCTLQPCWVYLLVWIVVESVCVHCLRFYIYKIVSSVHRDSFTFSFPIWISFLFLAPFYF